MADTNAQGGESQITYHRRRLEELKAIRAPYEDDWKDQARHIEPSRVRLVSGPEKPVSRRNIIDSTGVFAWRTAQAGMHSGLTSPARPWFKLTVDDPDLADFAPVKDYLAKVERRMQQMFAGSNIYNAFHTGYGDLLLLGGWAGLSVEDQTSVMRIQQFITGRFWIARDPVGNAYTLYRQFRWDVARIIARFGYEAVSNKVRQCYDQSKYNECFDIWQAVEPRYEREPGLLDKRNKPWMSNYWEDTSDTPYALLEESGFDENPIIAPAWEIAGEDHYSCTSPGAITNGDVRMLQREQTRKLEGIDKKVRPPMVAPTAMQNNPASLLPGSVTYVDDPTGKTYRAAFTVDLSLSDLREDIQETGQRINRGYFADLFQSLANMEGVQPRNQMELAMRKEEKLLSLGPVLENVYGSQLNLVIERGYNILNKRRLLPPPPRELRNVEVKVEYISMLAQAQKAVATGAIERALTFAGQLAAVKPEVMDKVDGDEAVDLYFDMVGAPPSIIVSDDKVKAIRDERLKQQQQAMAAEAANKMAPAVSAGASALTALTGPNGMPGNSTGSDMLKQIGIG